MPYRNHKGCALPEYGLVLGLISVVAIALLSAIPILWKWYGA